MHFSVEKLMILATLLSAGLITEADCLNFHYTSFQDSDADHFIVSSNSRLFLGAIQVTPDSNGANMSDRSGRVLYKKPFKLWNRKNETSSFNTTFLLNIRNQTNPGGEGLAFVLTPDATVPENSHGEWLGIVDPKLNGTSQANIVAIEFDTRKSYPDDLDDNHVGLDVNSVVSRRQFSMTSRGVKLSDGAKENITVVVWYDGESKNMTVFVEDTANPVFSETIDLSIYLPEEVYVGFSGSTGSETQLNCVRSWGFNGAEVDDDKLLWVWIVVSVSGAILVVSVAFFVFWKRKTDRVLEEDAYPNIEEAIQGSSNSPRKFRLKELRKATSNFSPKNKLGKGGFGTVYKGILENKELAVKKVSKKSTQGKTEFIAEVTTIGNLHHRNLVRLIGRCCERREFLLVYEYLPNGSLDKYIFQDKNSDMEEEPTLKWRTRLSVISGAAQALDYLHNGCERTVLHRDIKASNIMLDSEFNAKLGDFGLARTIKQRDQTHHSTKELAGTPGFMAPESILTGRFTTETDVYAFGVLILEVACGRKPGNQNQQNDYRCSLVNCVWELYKNGRILDAADGRLDENFEPADMEGVLVLGLACCHPNPNERPSMKFVLQVLKGETAPPAVPSERPAFMWPPLNPSFKELDVISLAQINPFTELTGR